MSRRRNWIQGAVEEPGALREWFKRNQKRLERELGYNPFKRDGRLREKAVRDTLKLAETGRLRVRTVTLRRLHLAETLFKLQKHRR